jgi:hypothetical protein
VPVAHPGAGLGALVRVRADHGRELGFDRRLADRFCCLPDPVIDLGGFEYLQDFEQGRLVQGDRGLCPFAKTIGVVSLTITRWPLRHP